MEHTPPAVIVDAPPVPLTMLEHLARRAADYARHTVATSTQKAYGKDWADFSGWCQQVGLDPLPASAVTVGVYLTACADRLAFATLARRLASISTKHRREGHRLDTGHPAIRDLMHGIRRVRGIAQRRVAPAKTKIVQDMVATCDDTLIGQRDRALILLGFAAALRRSELAGLTWDDVVFVAEGLRLNIVRSKTDQEARGEVVGVMRTNTPFCPVTALQAWLTASGMPNGKVFRRVDRHGHAGAALSDQSVALIVKKRVALVGLPASDFSGHSLRAGLATAAAANEVEERTIMRQTRHRSVAVLRTYIRDGEVFLANASGRVGL